MKNNKKVEEVVGERKKNCHRIPIVIILALLAFILSTIVTDSEDSNKRTQLPLTTSQFNKTKNNKTKEIFYHFRETNFFPLLNIKYS